VNFPILKRLKLFKGRGMGEKISAVFECILFFLVVTTLYLLALALFPLFREPFGLFVQMSVDGLFPISSLAIIAASSILFALAGGIMMLWIPAIPVRGLAWFWIAIYLFYWIDPLMGFWNDPEGWQSTLMATLGAVFLALFFMILKFWMPEEQLRYQPPTWRSRLAGGWFVVWMGFFTGTSSVLLSEVPLYPTRRLILSLLALGMAGWSYGLSFQLRKAQGQEEEGLSSTWRWLLAAWVILALLHYFFRVRDGM
jgi:hypothetical protein